MNPNQQFLPENIPQFQKELLAWHQQHGRHDLPWRQTHDPYPILVSEIMLQQTQVSRVIPKYHEFLAAFPTTVALANAQPKNLLAIWSGLGYWRRARFLQQTAQAIEEKYDGQFPQDPQELQKLPGLGPYTAGAVSCFAFNTPTAFIDTNIRRLFLHFFFSDKENVPDKDIQHLAEHALWQPDPRTWHYALFDYSAANLKQSKAHIRSKHYAKQSPLKGSFRFYRAHALKYVLAQPQQTIPRQELLTILEDKLHADEYDHDPEKVISALLKDKLLHQQNDQLLIP